MRLSDILFMHNVCLKTRHPQLDLRQARHREALTKLANAHSTDWLIKHFLDLEGSERTARPRTAAAAPHLRSGTLRRAP